MRLGVEVMTRLSLEGGEFRNQDAAVFSEGLILVKHRMAGLRAGLRQRAKVSVPMIIQALKGTQYVETSPCSRNHRLSLDCCTPAGQCHSSTLIQYNANERISSNIA